MSAHCPQPKLPGAFPGAAGFHLGSRKAWTAKQAEASKCWGHAKVAGPLDPIPQSGHGIGSAPCGLPRRTPCAGGGGMVWAPSSCGALVEPGCRRRQSASSRPASVSRRSAGSLGCPCRRPTTVCACVPAMWDSGHGLVVLAGCKAHSLGAPWPGRSVCAFVSHFASRREGYHNLLAEVSRQLGASFTDSGDYEKAHKDAFNPYLQACGIDPGNLGTEVGLCCVCPGGDQRSAAHLPWHR